MKLFTGKAEQDFEDWYYDNEAIYDVCTKLMGDMTGNIQMFYKLPFSMQSGVYMEWLRSVGVIIVMQPEDIPNDFDQLFEVCIAINKTTGLEWHNIGFQLKYNDGLTEAIKQAGEIYNEREQIPSITICRDTQCKGMGFTSWELHFEWLWLLLSFELESEAGNGK